MFSDFSYGDALIGVTTDNIAVYDYEKMVECLQSSQHWSREDSEEWIQYNTLRAYSPIGRTPIVMYPLIKEE